MSPRYYLVTAILVAVLTLVISVWKQKQTKREIFLVMVKVILALAVIVGGVLGVAQLLASLGVAQSGFFL
jgi:K+-sensing histidine kinase KdpD